MMGHLSRSNGCGCEVILKGTAGRSKGTDMLVSGILLLDF